MKNDYLNQYLLKHPPQDSDGQHLIAEKFDTTYDAIRKRCKRLGIELNTGGAKVKKVSFPDAIGQILEKVGNMPQVQPLPEIKVPVIKGKGDEEEAVLMLSDWQIGHKTSSFDSAIARQRVVKMMKAVFKIITLHRRAYPIKKINLLLEGDFIQSEAVGYMVDLSELEHILIDQVFGYAIPLLSWVISECVKNFEEVKVYCVRGNHGRSGRFSSEKTNWDDVIYKTLELKFNENPSVKFSIAREFYQVIKIQNLSVLLAHGDQVRGGSYGIPLYSLLQRMLRWATALPQRWDLWACAHWHHYSHIEQNGQEIIVNGTLVSDDEYVRRNYGWNASTLQVLFGVHPRKNITWMYRISLRCVK